MPGRTAARCSWEPVEVPSDSDLTDVRGDIAASQHWVASQCFDGFRTALAGHLAGADAPNLTLSDDDVASFSMPRRELDTMPEVLFALTSHDRAWHGLQHGRSALVFRNGVIAELSLFIGHPARGSGGYDLEVTFGELVPVETFTCVQIAPNGERREVKSTYRRTSRFQLAYRFGEAASFRLLRAIHAIAAQWELPVRVQEYSDV